MGQRILTLAHQSSGEFAIGGAYEVQGHPALGQDAGTALGLGKTLGVKVTNLLQTDLSNVDAIIDFSGSDGTQYSVNAAVHHKKPLVIGSTGLDLELAKKIHAAAEKTPIVLSSNMSIGVNVLLEIVALAAVKLGKDFDIEITEAHHRHKKDAPSGTALMLADSIARAKKWDLKKVMKFREAGKVDEERSHEEIGMQVIRAGEIVGDHTALFGGPAETIEITHRAHSRDAFARGALTAAAFLARQGKPGRVYTMRDVLGL